MKNRRTIGIVGGVGPYAGVELCKKILEQTKASKDQEHLPIIMISLPEVISDRTAFITGETDVNPAFAIVEIIKKLELAGAEVVAIACNTSHAPVIYDVICRELERLKINIKLLNLVDEVVKYIRSKSPTIKNIGVMSTKGSYKSKIYENALKTAGFNAIIPDKRIQEDIIHKAIYNKEYGIKTKSNPIDKRAREQLLKGIEHVKLKGGDAVILGCTEMSLSITEDSVNDVKIIDSMKVLAKALIRESLVEK